MSSEEILKDTAFVRWLCLDTVLLKIAQNDFAGWASRSMGLSVYGKLQKSG